MILWAGTVFGLFFITILRRERGAGYSVLLVPFYSWRLYFSGVEQEALRSNLMNMILFMPFGILTFLFMPLHWNIGKRMLVLAASACALSIIIEISQYLLQCGSMETDDVINNTLGAVVGAMLFWVEIKGIKCIRRKNCTW